MRGDPTDHAVAQYGLFGVPVQTRTVVMKQFPVMGNFQFSRK